MQGEKLTKNCLKMLRLKKVKKGRYQYYVLLSNVHMFLSQTDTSLHGNKLSIAYK